MAAPQPSTLDLITAAYRKLGILGAGQSAPNAEDTALALDEFNGIVEQMGLRHRNSYFERTQAFTFTTSRTSYSIGTTANSANFVVSAGDRPIRIEYASVVNTDVTPNQRIPVDIIPLEIYSGISIPALASLYPTSIYYQPTVPNGTIFPYPASPTKTAYQLELTWWNILDTVAIADISTALVLPAGFRRGLPLKLAIALWPAFTKRSDLDELRRQEREVWADIQSVNTAPPLISSTDGIGSGAGTFDYRSRTWL